LIRPNVPGEQDTDMREIPGTRSHGRDRVREKGWDDRE